MSVYVDIHFQPWFISFKKEKKTSILKPTRTYNKTPRVGYLNEV